MWYSLFCCLNLRQAWLEVCWIVHLITSDSDSCKICFLLSWDVQVQAGNLCGDHKVHVCPLKYIGKKHCTLWNRKGTLKYIGKKHYTLWNIHKHRNSRNNTYPNHTLKYILLNYHQAPPSRLIFSFLVCEQFEIRRT